MSSKEREHSDSSAATGKERRVWVRRPCELDGFCQPPVGSGALQWAAKIEDVSEGGIAIVVDRRFELGALLAIEVQQDDSPVTTVLARVVRVIKKSHGRWLLGCSLAKRMKEEDLAELV
jgi:PilZ domain